MFALQHTRFTLRPYQEQALEDIQQALQSDRKVVFAACPGSGKTLTTLALIDRYYADSKVLILTHGTNVIKDTWTAEADVMFGKMPDNVIYGLPQAIIHKPVLPQIDLLVIDEAHEFTFVKRKETSYEGMVTRIIKRCNPKHILFLTGTPSKFIKQGGYTPIIIPAIDLIKQDYLSDLYVGVVSTTADLSLDTDYNQESDDLNATGAAKLVTSAAADLDSLVDAILTKLKTQDWFKRRPDTLSLVGRSFATVFGSLKKTLIACASIAQADKVTEILKQKQVSALCSHSKNDESSDNIRQFMKDDTSVLVVVDRGILGFNMPSLVNVVDLTGSRNIDRIYQLYARAIRKSSDAKYFFKFAPVVYRDLFKFYTQAALCLMFPDFIKLYNGRNLGGMQIPVKVVARALRSKPAGSERTSQATRPKTSPRTWSVDFTLEQTVLAAFTMDDAYHKLNDVHAEFAYVTFAKLKHSIMGGQLRDPTGNKQALRDRAIAGDTRPSKMSKDMTERKLGKVLSNYTRPTSSSYDEQFTNELKALRPDWFVNTADVNKQALRDRAIAGGTRPNTKSKDIAERKLGQALSSYTSSASEAYDEQFANELKALRPDWFTRSTRRNN